MINKIITLLILLCFNFLYACNEDVSSDFQSYDDLVKIKYLENGWIPTIIPIDAKNIKEIHNLDLNSTFGKFEFSSHLFVDSILILQRISSRTIKENIARINRPSRPDWFISDSKIDQINPVKVIYEDFYIIVDTTLRKAYFLKYFKLSNEFATAKKPTLTTLSKGSSLLRL